MTDNAENQAVAPQARWFKPDLYRLRLISGLILFLYILVHFFNHSLGLISLDAMQEGGKWLARLVRNTPFGYLLYAAIAVHMIASLWRVYTRRSLKMPAREWAQLIMGLLIPPLMIVHIMGTRYANEVYGINDNYWYVVLVTFVYSPLNGILNAVGLVTAWVHACIGLHMWFQLKAFYTATVRNILLVLATALPITALAGYLSAGREIGVLAASGEWLEQYYAQLNLSDDGVWALIGRDTDIARLILLLALAGFILARLVRNYWARRSSVVAIDYLDGPVVRQPIGNTLLDMSRLADIPHASVCGGRGRCSTCRVQIVSADGDLDPPSEAEQRVLDRVNAPENVRLACQWRPQHNSKIMRLLPADATMKRTPAGEPWATGQERIVSILFADIRNFTRTAETRLPFDVVYLINQFSREMGQAVEARNGHVDKFLGDGLMAIFGISTTPEQGSRHALEAAADMGKRLDALNARLVGDLPSPLRMGIGIHTGTVVLGDMGYGAARGLTAIGDTVNTASRLETETKEQGTLACISAETANYAGIEPQKTALKRVTVRGREQKLDIFALNGLTIDKLIADKTMVKERESV